MSGSIQLYKTLTNNGTSFPHLTCIYNRVESFIEHQDACNMGRLRPESQPLQQQPPAACLSRTASSPSPSSETNFSTGPWQTRLQVVPPKPIEVPTIFMNPTPIHPPPETSSKNNNKLHPNLELQLQLSTTNNKSSNPIELPSPKNDQNIKYSTQLQLSIGSPNSREKNEASNNRNLSPKESSNSIHEKERPLGGGGGSGGGGANMALMRNIQEQARENLRIAMAEKAYAEEARKQAKRQIEIAEQEFTNAKRIRQQAQAELDKAYNLKEHAMKQVNSTMMQITCHACRQQFQAAQDHENSFVFSYMSSAITTEGGEVENDHHGKDN